MKTKILITIDEDLLKQLDDNLGLVKRSPYIEDLIRKDLVTRLKKE